MKILSALLLLISIAQAEVELKVIVTDRAGRPVKDLQPGDLRISDDGSSPVSVTSLRPIQSQTDAPAVVILLDLMNLTFPERGQAVNQIRALAPRQASDKLRLYLLLADGHIFPVQDIGQQLDSAIQKVNQLRPLTIKADPIERFNTKYSALDSMSQELAGQTGMKHLLWITEGLPSRMQGVYGWMELTPQLTQLAAQFNRANSTVYSVNPSLSPDSTNLEGLAFLSARTGGQALGSIDLKTALAKMEADTAATYLLDYLPSTETARAGIAIHTARLTSTRKGIRIRSQQVYLNDAIKAPPKASATAQNSALHVLPAEPAYTFVGVVHSLEGRGLILELEDARFIVVDFDKNARINLNLNDRVSVRSKEYNGHGLVAKSWSVLVPAPSTAPIETTQPQRPASATLTADASIQLARDASTRLTRALPDFVCNEDVTRNEHGMHDTLSAEVSYTLKKGEEYRGIRVNGQPTDKSWVALGGDVSTGEFGTLLRSIFANPDADFQFVKEDLIGAATAVQYSFHISRERSDWKILSDYQFVIPQYSGHIWIDKSSRRVLRVERTAEAIPAGFPLSAVESDVNFGEVHLGTSDAFLLPILAETRVWVRNETEVRRKTIAFRDYRRFTAESKLIPE